jgi:hypothetical protein
MQQALITGEWLLNNIHESRAKDYENPFRKMVYDTEKEMEKVIGRLSENSFILEQQREFADFKKRVNELMEKLFPG